MRINTKLINTIGAVERVVEKVVEVPFNARREIDVHDFEIHLTKTMEAHKTEYWHKIFVPNVYILQLQPEIYRRYYALIEQLQTHLTTFIKRSIFERGYFSVDAIAVKVKEGYSEQGSEVEVICQIRRETDTGEPKYISAQLRTADKTYEMSSESLTIGRDEDNDVVLESEFASAQHACIRQTEDGGFTLIDLGSTNGSEVNGLEITQPITIETGDELTFGDVSLTFFVTDNSPDREAAEEHFNAGLMLHEASRLKEATSEYRQAIRLEPSLAEAHFNIGVISWERYRDGEVHQLSEGIHWYRRGLKINPDEADAHANLAKLYEEKGCWDEAISHLESALELVSEHDAATRRLKRVKDKRSYYSLFEQNPKFYESDAWRIGHPLEIREDSLFKIELYVKLKDDALNTMCGILQEARGDVKDILDYQADRIDIAIYPDERDTNDANSFPLSWAAGVYDKEIKLKKSCLFLSYGLLRRLLRHEYVHSAVNRITNGNCPIWLYEGLSEYIAQEMFEHEREILRKAAQRGEHFSIAQLEEFFQNPTDGNRRQLAYLEACLIVEFIVNNNGLEQLRQLLRQLQDGQSIEDAMMATLEVSVAELESMWRS